MPVTRSQHTAVVDHEDPPTLVRQSALARVRIAPEGRALARKLLMDTDAVYDYWFSVSDDGRLHHFASVTDTRRQWSLPYRMTIPLVYVSRYEM